MAPDQKWDPIPEHAVEIDGRPMLPERLTEIGGVQYVRCYLHGLIPADHRCEESPSDHYCGVAAHPNQPEGEDHDDQATSHRDWSVVQSDKLRWIANLHVKAEIGGGMTSGCCSECDHEWPCPTVHIANGWGQMYDCWDEGWCKHAGVVVTSTDDFVADLAEATEETDD